MSVLSGVIRVRRVVDPSVTGSAVARLWIWPGRNWLQRIRQLPDAAAALKMSEFMSLDFTTQRHHRRRLFVGGIQLIGFVVAGEYVSRALDKSRRRLLCIIERIARIPQPALLSRR